MRISFLIAVFLVQFFALSCGDSAREEKMDPDQMTGEQLSVEFCAKCHQYPDPAWLSKAQWKPVLDRMALHLGLQTGVDPYRGKILEEVFMIQQAEVFRDTPAMEDSTWQRLVAYYLAEAPDSLTVTDDSETMQNTLFDESFPEIDMGGFPVVTLVQYDTLADQLYVADLNNQLMRLKSDFSEDQVTVFLAPVVHLTMVDSINVLATQIGFMDKVDQKAGLIEMTDRKNLSQRARILIELIRPVFTEIGDLDGDQSPDLLVSSFGNLVGDLSWYSYRNQSYEKHLLRNKPGALQTRILDADNDGDQDILALFGQAQEGVSLYINNHGNFEERKLLEFNPLYGCSDFEVVDFDADQDLDIILANGDNGDYSPGSKPYHGVRILENKGQWNLEETTFIPVHGATGIECADFDQDADLDLLVSCFYPDPAHLDESIIYLENLDNKNFVKRKFNLAPQGRWLVCETGDLDQDGDIDAFVGSFALGPGEFADSIRSIWTSSENHLLYLENKLIDR